VTAEPTPVILQLGPEPGRPFADFLARLAPEGDEARFRPYSLAGVAAVDIADNRVCDTHELVVDRGRAFGHRSHEAGTTVMPFRV
jgi:hypothetical protein